MSSPAAAGTDSAPTVLRNLWYRAAPAGEIRKGRLVRRILVGEPVVLGRMHDGRAFALRDICPHRAVPLSAGRILEENLVECAYHGWRFAADGQCKLIPSLVDGQEFDCSRIRVRGYPLCEQDGQIWVFVPTTGRETDLPAIVPPKVPLRGDARPRWAETQRFRCAMDHAVVGLMDPAHGPFVHQAWYWRTHASIHPKAKRFSPSERGFVMTAHRPSANSFAYRLLGGDVTTEIRFELPGIRFEHIRAGSIEVVGLTTCTPIDNETTEVTQTFYWNKGWLNLALPALGPFARAFLGQDRAMVELQRDGLKYHPRLMFVPDADTPAMWYHRLKKAWNESVETGAPFANPVPEATLRWRS